MTKVQVGQLGTATLNGRTWSSELPSIQSHLQGETDRLFIHGGIPDEEEFIVHELAQSIPLSVIEKVDQPEDPEAVEAEASDDTETVY